MTPTTWLAIATFVLAFFAAVSAVASLLLARQNRKLVEQNRIMVWRPYYVELVALVIDRLLSGVESLKNTQERKGYDWGPCDKE